MNVPALAQLNSSVTIRAEIPFGLQGAAYDLAVFDLVGRRVERIASGTLKAGHLQQEWRPADAAAASTLHPGIYYVRLQTPKQTLTRKIVLVF